MRRRFMRSAAVVVLLCALAGVAALVWRERNRSVRFETAKHPSETEARVNPNSVDWLPAVEPGPHPLLKTADQAVWAEGDALSRRGGPEYAGSRGDLAKPRVDGRGLAPLRIDYPKNESVFPPEIVAPTFLWHESAPQAD